MTWLTFWAPWHPALQASDPTEQGMHSTGGTGSMNGQVFITQGDITRLYADAIAVTSGSAFRKSSENLAQLGKVTGCDLAKLRRLAKEGHDGTRPDRGRAARQDAPWCWQKHRQRHTHRCPAPKCT